MTYCYTCTSCANNWEANHGMNDPPIKACPECGNDTAKRLIAGAATFVLKGGGWYADGYGSRKVSANGV